jgi:microcin C transport system substrate-binding protein
LPHKQVAGMQSFAFNARRKQFQDPRVRLAFNYVFDFENANKTRFYGAYVRASSYFGNSELAATGLPEGRELELLKSVESEVPKEVFTTVYKPPQEADQRASMNAAHQLLKAAGWTTRMEERDSPDCGWWCRIMMTVGLRSAEVETVLRNAAGETLNAEFLLVQPNFEPIVLPFIADLKKLGINASVRTVDSSQYTRRVEQHDFDIIVDSWPQSHSPGNEQRDLWGTEAADKPGSNNSVGIKNPAVDKLIDAIIFAKDRAELVAATRALDRVLLWNHYVIPQWNFPFVRLASWDKLGRPEKLPSQSPLFIQSWWLDADKEKALGTVTSQ